MVHVQSECPGYFAGYEGLLIWPLFPDFGPPHTEENTKC